MKFVRKAKFGMVLAVVVAAGGCASSSKPAMEAAQKIVPTNAAFTRGVTAKKTSSDYLGINNWVKSFHSPNLTALVNLAMVRNPDLQATAARWREAQAQVQLAQADLYPHLNGSLTAQREDPGHKSIYNTFSGKLSVQWQVDVWGQLAEEAATSKEQAIASGLTYQYARFSLAATVAQAWFTAIAAQKQLVIDQELLATQQHTAQVADNMYQGGTGTPLNTRLSQANVHLAKSAVIADKQSIEQAKRALQLLLGQYPSGLLDVTNQLPDLPGPVITGVPSQLLERRPDVLAANHLVAAAFHQKKAAEAARLPQITLTASLGAVLDPTDMIWSIGAGLLQPLFEGGKINAGIKITKAQQREAIANYVAVGIQAFSEVEAALANESYLTKQLGQLDTASNYLSEASRIAEGRYEAGIISIFNLNQTRSQYFNTRLQLLGAQAQRLIQRVDLYLALGGTPGKKVTTAKASKKTDTGSEG